jgi:hypothetical protein
MQIDNKIERPFGKNASFVGVIFLLAGTAMLLFGAILPGIIAILLASLVVFTWSGVQLDTEKHLVRPYNKWFGLLKTGPGKSLQNFIGVTLIPVTTKESMASWSNRTTTSRKTDYRIFLVNMNKKPAFAIKTCKTREEGQRSLDEFSIWLKVPVYSVKR